MLNVKFRLNKHLNCYWNNENTLLSRYTQKIFHTQMFLHTLLSLRSMIHYVENMKSPFARFHPFYLTSS